MLKRQQKRIDVGEGKVRYRVQLLGENCHPASKEGRVLQNLILKELADNELALLNCGPKKWEKLSIWHNGECWEVNAESEVDEVDHTTT